MHNLISRNQLDTHNHWDVEDNTDTIMNDYFECIMECELDNNNCKTICKEILM